MSLIQRFDHVGITVADLDAVTAFFVGLGLEVEGRTFVEGEFVDTVTGIPDVRTEIVMLRPPDGGTRLELLRFVRPAHEPGSPSAMANELGLRNVAFEVADVPRSRRPAGRGRLRPRRRDRRLRGHVADGLRPRARGDHRVLGRSASADTLAGILLDALLEPAPSYLGHPTRCIGRAAATSNPAVKGIQR